MPTMHKGPVSHSRRPCPIHERRQQMKDWITWSGGECPIKSDRTRVEYECASGFKNINTAKKCRWAHINNTYDIIAYRIIEDHEPKMTREQITAQIDALQKQLDALPVLVIRMHWDGQYLTEGKHAEDTHYFDIETINGVPHIHGVAMKEVGK
jgi:hypothetical protein